MNERRNIMRCNFYTNNRVPLSNGYINVISKSMSIFESRIHIMEIIIMKFNKEINNETEGNLFKVIKTQNLF